MLAISHMIPPSKITADVGMEIDRGFGVASQVLSYIFFSVIFYVEFWLLAIHKYIFLV